ncbi:MAG: hypothetical protein ACK6EB_24635, partial [Planctomyces sp.]
MAANDDREHHQPGYQQRPQVLAAAQAADHHCPNRQHTLTAVLWQPSPDRSETRQQLLDSAFFYVRLEKTICLLLRELRPWQHAEELK